MTHKVVFCWTGISGYMAACWRALHSLPNIDVAIMAFQSDTEIIFPANLIQGIPSRLLDTSERLDSGLIKQWVLSERPDVVVISGWLHKPYRQLAFAPELRNTAFVMGMDTLWKGTIKQHVAPWLLRPYLRRMRHVVVTGERSQQYARRLGVHSAHIMPGLYGVDYAAWESLWAKRQQQAWPRSFLFAGRYIPIKAIDLLVDAYQQYRRQVLDPWSLVCCGQGPLADQLRDQPGITDLGFVAPEAMKTVWQNAGAFLLPSRSDAWPLALVEAAAAGLPLICSDVCGSAVEILRVGYNGLVVPSDDSERLANALLTLHQRYAELPKWGARSQQLAAPYAAEVWANRWQTLIHQVSSGVSA